jgi:hypothetical protein
VDKVNVTKSIEEAIKTSLIAGGASGGIPAVNVFYNLFMDATHTHAAAFPQIEITASPDVPDGQEIDKVSNLRRVSVSILILTKAPDDPTHETIVSLYERVRSALDDANKDLDTWSSTNLPSGWFANCVLVQDAPEPYFDSDIQIIGLPVMVEVCVA